MTKILFLYKNLLDLANLVASSEADGFPAENVQHPFRSKVWRTEGTTPGTANLVIDFGAAVNIDCVALADYNWASAPGTLDLEFNSSDSWGTPAATEALTWAANPTTNGNPAIIIKKFATKNYRYVRLNVVYATGDWDLGRIFLGSYFEPATQYAYPRGLDLVDPSYIDRAVGGQPHVDEIPDYRTLALQFRVRTEAQLLLFQKMWREVGIRKSLFVAVDYDSSPNEMTMYGNFTGGNMPTSWAGVKNYPVSLSFEEMP